MPKYAFSCTLVIEAPDADTAAVIYSESADAVARDSFGHEELQLIGMEELPEEVPN